jgi:hypothetical protein
MKNYDRGLALAQARRGVMGTGSVTRSVAGHRRNVTLMGRPEMGSVWICVHVMNEYDCKQN